MVVLRVLACPPLKSCHECRVPGMVVSFPPIAEPNIRLSKLDSQIEREVSQRETILIQNQ